MTNYNTMCFEREEDKERLMRGAKCLCKKCREARSKIKVDPEETKERRRLRAIEIVKGWIN